MIFQLIYFLLFQIGKIFNIESRIGLKNLLIEIMNKIILTLFKMFK